MSQESSLVAAVHARLLDTPDLGADLGAAIRDAVRELAPLLGHDERRRIESRVRSELAGLGALDTLLDDDGIGEVMVNAGREVWVDREGCLERIGVLPDGAALVLLERILAPLGRRLDRRSPMVDARLPDGSRVCAVIAPAAADGPTFTIRRFGSTRRSLHDFATRDVVVLLEQIVRARCNVVVSGATSSGKTSLLNTMAGLVPDSERIITLEDTVELSLRHDHVVRLEARAESADGVPAIGLDALLRAALRLRPDRIVVGEVRGAEALVLVQAMGTGHDGSLATVHANDASDALRRLEVLIMQAAPSWPLDAVREHIASSVDVIVHVRRGPGGRREVSHVAEVVSGDASGDQASAYTAVGVRLRTLASGHHVLTSLTRTRHAAER